MSIFSARIAVLGLLLVSAGASAAPQWWQAIYTTNSNNQINLKDENNTSVTAITNPTSANVKLNTNITTQPPTVIVQATATLPTVAIGSACTFGTSTAALSSSDRLTLLSCGSGNTWQIASRISLPVVTAGAACSITTDGNMAVDSAGLTLSCQSGVWKKAASAPSLQSMFTSAYGGITDYGPNYMVWGDPAGTCPIGYYTIGINGAWTICRRLW